MPEESTVLVPLTQGKYAVIDAIDAEMIFQHKWHLGGSRYATRSRKQSDGEGPKYIFMHRVVAGLGDFDGGEIVDHIDGDTLNNRRHNLRVCNQAQNLANVGAYKNNTSGFRGVSMHLPKRPWVAGIQVNKKRIHLGRFATPEDAARAYDRAAKELLGEFANLNFPEEH